MRFHYTYKNTPEFLIALFNLFVCLLNKKIKINFFLVAVLSNDRSFKYILTLFSSGNISVLVFQKLFSVKITLHQSNQNYDNKNYSNTGGRTVLKKFPEHLRLKNIS